ncbi:S1C family serine protease [Candidatus Nitrospira bockiana]
MMPSFCSIMLSAAAFVSLLGLPAIGAEPPTPRFAPGIDKAKRATVGILDPATPAEATPAHFTPIGSGFHIGDGYIVTARHVVDRDESGRPMSPKDVRVLTTELDELPASLVGVNAFLDIAVYRIRPDVGTLPPAVRLTEQEPEAGEELFTVGYPLGWGPAVAFGRLGNPNTFVPTVDTRLFQVDLSACSGNSGAGLFNANGDVIGVVHAIIQTETTQGERRCSRFAFSVPGQLVQRVVAALIEGRQPGFSRLGVQLTAVKSGTRWRVAVSESMGPAYDGGIRKGDILLSIDETTITDGVQLKNYLIERTSPGQTVAVKVLRGQQEQVLKIRLGAS